MNGLLNYQDSMMGGLLDPRTQALLAASGGLLTAGGRQAQPVGAGDALGRGLLAGMHGYNQGLLGNQQYAMSRMQMDEFRRKTAASQDRQTQLNAYAETLPPDQRQAFLLSPDTFLKERFAPFTLKPGETRFVGDRQTASIPTEPRLEQLPVPDQPGVTQGYWLRPGETTGTPVGAPRQPEILHPAVQAARAEVAKAGAPQVIVSTEKKYGEAFGGKVAEADISMRDAAIKAPELAERANRVREVLMTGKVITGAGADYRLALGKALNLAGATDAETITNTETLATSLAQNTLDAIKASGLGAGSGFSNADRDFLEKAVGGKINLEGKTIERLAELSHRAAAKSAERWNSRVKQIPISALEGTGINTDPVSVPSLLVGKRKTDVLPSGRSRADILKLYGVPGQ